MVTCRRRGFTRVGCLVLLAMATVLGGLLVLAVQKIQEAGLRTQCTNNLRLLGLATHNCSDTYHYLPSNPGTVGDYSGTVQWLLLPFME